MSDITISPDISPEAIKNLIPRLISTSASSSISRTNLPTILPLAFPTHLHLLNTITCIHLLHSILVQPTHTAYFAETSSDPSDTAVMGVLGLYLSSTEDWGAQNLLSSAAWKSGNVDEALLSEVFRVETTREREHETMKAIRVGGRWEPGAKVVEDLITFFRGSAGILGKMQCVGEWVKTVVEDSWKDGEEVESFAKNCCDWATSVCPSLRDSYEMPDSAILPYLPLRLIHALAVRQEASGDLDLRLPKPADLEDITPLPLSLPVLFSAGILKIADSSDLRQQVGNYDKSTTGITQVEMSASTYATVLAKSVQACQAIRKAAEQEGLSYLDVHLAIQQLQAEEERSGKKLVFTLKVA